MNKVQQQLSFYWSLLILDVFTFVFNLTTSIMFIKFRRRLLVSTHNRILFSLSLADTLVGIFGFSLGALLYFKQPSSIYKLAGNIPMFSSLFGSVLALVLLTIDRLVAVKKPFMYSSRSYRRLITRLIIVTWIVPALVTINQALIFIYLSSKKELIARSVLFAVFFILAAAVLIVFNLFLIVSLNRHFSKTRVRAVPVKSANSFQTCYESEKYSIEKCETSVIPANVTSDPVDSIVQLAAKEVLEATSNASNAIARAPKKKVSMRTDLKQTSIFCVLLVLLFIIFWAPLTVYRCYYAVGISLKIAWLRRLALCLTIANSLLNPVFYFFAKKELRKYLLQLFHCVK